MKLLKLLFILLTMSMSWGLYAQQAAQYSQFNFDKLWFNPAYAGTHEAMAIQAIVRQQWIGFEGAPSSQSISAHAPFFDNKVGLGVMIDKDAFGPLESYNLTGAYAYRFTLNQGILSVGVQTTINNFRLHQNGLNTLEKDESIVDANYNMVSPNFGTGLFYKADNFFLGVSIPNLMRLKFLESAELPNNLRLPASAYFTGGRVFQLTETIDIQPSVLIRYAANTPVDVDLSTSFIFLKNLYTGVNYRIGGNNWGESLDFLLQYRFSNGLKIGGAYDFTLSKLRNEQNGSIELMVQYIFASKDGQLTNPRFF